MPLILNIDTAGEKASIALAENGSVLGAVTNDQQRDHAAWIHEAIRKLMVEHETDLSALEAIAVTAGPGSYTGLRVGMATAKGLAYALGIPFITENTLRVMAYAATRQLSTPQFPRFSLFVPMIDARRMEVFTAVYDLQLNVLMEPQAKILDTAAYEGFISADTVFFGSGSLKFKQLMETTPASFADLAFGASDLAVLSYEKFRANEFSDIAYSEPVYLKEFYSPKKIN